MKIGCISFQPLGKTLVRRLMLRHQLNVFDVDAQAALEFQSAGAVVSNSLSDLARSSDVIVICARKQEDDLQALLFNQGDLIEGLSSGKLVVDLTAGDPEQTRAVSDELEKLGITLVDAPVHSELWSDLEGSAAILCGGTADAIGKVRPVLEAITPRVVECGAVGSGHAAYLVVQGIAACNRLITLECASLGVKQGLTVNDMATVLNNSSGRNNASERVLPALAAGGRTADVQIGQIAQELRLVSRAAANYGAPVLMGNVVHSVFETAVNQLGAATQLDDMSKFYESMTGARFLTADLAP